MSAPGCQLLVKLCFNRSLKSLRLITIDWTKNSSNTLFEMLLKTGFNGSAKTPGALSSKFSWTPLFLTQGEFKPKKKFEIVGVQNGTRRSSTEMVWVRITWLELGSRVNYITKRTEMFKINFCVWNHFETSNKSFWNVHTVSKEIEVKYRLK